MKHVKFNKTVCGVDFLLNVIDIGTSDSGQLSKELQTADFFQIVFITKGQGHVLLNNQKIELAANKVLFISQHQKYQWFVQRETFEARFLVFQDNFLNDFFADQFFTYRLLYFYQSELPLFIMRSAQNLQQYNSQLEEIKKELIKPLSDSVHLIRSILYYLLAKLNRAYAEEYKIADSEVNDSTAFQFRKLVENNIATKQRVEDYTQLMNISRITLNKVVKQQFNQTASNFLKSRLLHELKMELMYSHKNIDQVAHKYNFSEPNHFSRFFKKQTGVTPSEFRINYQNGSNT